MKTGQWKENRWTGAQSVDDFRGNEAEARRVMAAHGIKPPRPCSCPNPALHTDYDDDTSCLLCGRRPA